MADLVIQGPAADQHHAEHLLRLSGAVRFRAVAPGAFRLEGARSREGVQAWCGAERLDFAWLERPLRLTDFGLLAMDMDSTLIAIECIDEVAALAGAGERVAAITDAAMRGRLDYAESLRQRVALLAGTPERLLEQVYRERLSLSPGAEALLSGARAAGLKTMLVSGGFTYFTDRLRQRLGFDDARSNRAEVEDGRLTGRIDGPVVDARGKREAMEQARDSLGLAPAQVIAIGDGANDLEMLRAAGLSIAYRAKPVVRAEAMVRIDHCGLDAVLNLFV